MWNSIRSFYKLSSAIFARNGHEQTGHPRLAVLEGGTAFREKSETAPSLTRSCARGCSLTDGDRRSVSETPILSQAIAAAVPVAPTDLERFEAARIDSFGNPTHTKGLTPMKMFPGAALTALLLSVPLMASAASLRNRADQPSFAVASADPASEPPANGNDGSQWASLLNNQDGIHLHPATGLGQSQGADPIDSTPIDSTMTLVNRTGGGD
jgi:hypothetical protein